MTLGSTVKIDCLGHGQIHNASHDIRYEADSWQNRVITEAAGDIRSDIVGKGSLEVEDEISSP